MLHTRQAENSDDNQANIIERIKDHLARLSAIHSHLSTFFSYHLPAYSTHSSFNSAIEDSEFIERLQTNVVDEIALIQQMHQKVLNALYEDLMRMRPETAQPRINEISYQFAELIKEINAFPVKNRLLQFDAYARITKLVNSLIRFSTQLNEVSSAYVDWLNPSDMDENVGEISDDENEKEKEKEKEKKVEKAEENTHTENSTSGIMILADEVLVKICSYLSPKEQFVLLLMNRRFYHIASDDYLWNENFKRYFPTMSAKQTGRSKMSMMTLFGETQRLQLQNVHPRVRNLISMIKQGNVDELEKRFDTSSKAKPNYFEAVLNFFLEMNKSPIIPLADLTECDKTKCSPLEYARKHPTHSQELLDCIYAFVKTKYTKKDVLDAKKRDGDGRSILHWAVLCNQPIHIIDELVTEHHCDPMAKTYQSETLLHLAASQIGSKILVAHLLSQYKLSLLDLNDQEETPLIVAIKANHQDAFALLWQDINYARTQSKMGTKQTPYHVAVKGQNIEALELLLSLDGQFSIENLGARCFGEEGATEQTPLCSAIRLKNPGLVKTILEHAKIQGHESTVVNQCLKIPDTAVLNKEHCRNGFISPLQLAVITHQPDIVLLLLEHQADAGAYPRKASKYATAYELAILRGQTNLLKILVANDPRFRQNINEHGLQYPPLYLAALNRNYEMVDCLLKAGADVDQPVLFTSISQITTPEIAELLHEAIIRKRLSNVFDPTLSPRQQAILFLNVYAPRLETNGFMSYLKQESIGLFSFLSTEQICKERVRSMVLKLESMNDDAFNEKTFDDCIKQFTSDIKLTSEVEVIINNIRQMLALQVVIKQEIKPS